MSTNVNVNATGGNTYGTRDMTGRSTVAGLFHDRQHAEVAINDLRDAGFKPEDVGVAMRDRDEQGRLAEDTGTNAGTGAVSGALGGGLLGGVVGFLVGIGALAIPGIGPVIAGGALASAFGVAGGTAVAGAGIGAAAGGLVGALVGMGIPEEEARHFERGFNEGGVLITVRAQHRAMDALAILERHGADTGPGSMATRGTGSTLGGSERTSTVSGTTRGDSFDHTHTGASETAAGTVAGGAAGAIAGSAIAGPAGGVVGGVIGAVGGAASGKAIHEARPSDHEDKAAEGTSGGALAGGAAGAAIGTIAAGPPGTAAGAAIGGAAGAVTGASAGAAADGDDDDDDRRATTDRTVRR